MASILVIGHGSIGSRHAKVARELGHKVGIVTRRGTADGGGGGGGGASFGTVAEALSEGVPDGAIIATETGRHAADLQALRTGGFLGPILVEKPIFSRLEEFADFGGAAEGCISVAYNLRFHPLVQRTRMQLAGAHVMNIIVHVGQDLHQWRNRPVGQTYSSRKDAGGGVLRDLSHELDYLLWIFGPWATVSAAGGRLGNLPGDADDAWGIILRFASGAMATVSIDYFCNPPLRTLTVNTNSGTVRLDLVRGVWSDGADETVLHVDRDATYRLQMTAWLDGESDVCSLDEGLEVLRLIHAIERSAMTGREVRA